VIQNIPIMVKIMSVLTPSEESIRNSYIVRNLVRGVQQLRGSRLALFALVYLGFIFFLAIFGQDLAPYNYQETMRGDSGLPLRAAGASAAHPLGTTDLGYDVLSRLLVGAQPTALAGLLGGAMIITIGLTVGVTAGYMGGRVDAILMRFTDIVYSVPLIPFAIVLMAVFGIGYLNSVIVIGLVLWRGSARVLRSQVLQIKERPYVRAAKATGAGNLRIVLRHILPNIAPMAALYFALGVGYSIIVQASLAFIGVSSPFLPSWGVMIRNAYESGFMASQPFWAVVPGLMISMTVLSVFLLGREFEEEGDEGLATGG
jgi:peptide/nickel transport system permease protein